MMRIYVVISTNDKAIEAIFDNLDLANDYIAKWGGNFDPLYIEDFTLNPKF